jgi:hypothetical protein
MDFDKLTEVMRKPLEAGDIIMDIYNDDFDVRSK